MEFLIWIVFVFIFVIASSFGKNYRKFKEEFELLLKENTTSKQMTDLKKVVSADNHEIQKISSSHVQSIKSNDPTGMSVGYKILMFLLWLAFFTGFGYYLFTNYFQQKIITYIEENRPAKGQDNIHGNTDKFPISWQEANKLNERGRELIDSDPYKAEAVFREAIAKDPTYHYAYNNLGIVLSKTGRSSEALELYAEVLKIKPDYAKAYTNMGAIYVEDFGELDKAMEMYQKAISISQDDPNPYGNMAIVLDKVGGKNEEARTYFKKVIELGSTNEYVIRRAKELGLIE